MSELSHILRLCSIGQLREAITAFHSLPPATLLNPHTYATLLHFSARHRILDFGRFLHHHLLRFSNPADPLPVFLSNHLINLYSKCSCPDVARHLFDEMPSRNIVSWTALITGYSQNGLHEDCFLGFAQMVREDCLPNDFGFVGVLSSCSETGCGARGRQVHGLALKVSFDSSVYVGNALINMYSRCCGCDDGWALFRDMRWRNSITWNSMINGFAINGCPFSSVELFVDMLYEGFKADRATMVTVLSACCCFEICRQVHALATKISLALEVEVATALIKAYSAVGMELSDCYRVFSEARRKDTMSWTGIITSFADSDPERAILLFSQLRSQGIVPDRHTFSIVVKACAGLATERHGSAVHSLILKSGFENDVVVANSLIHAYARCGNVHLAECVFKGMVYHDLVTWNSLIKAYAMHGRAEDALRVFSGMSSPPDSTTFIGLLSACSHKGLVDEGRKLFKTMIEDYGIPPAVGHYACMIDILGRVGLLLEAEALIHEMPVEPDSVVWNTLLAACRKHKETNIAEKAAQKLMELQPRSSAGYILMSNIYSAEGSFHDAAYMRKDMKECGVNKQPGLSWIEVRNRVHEFAVGGRRHPQIKEIYFELKRVVGKLKEVGYIAETSLVLHEIEEEHKEERILLHSEKLAFVFGLMNASPAQICIRIMKNIRTCVDCHNFMKIASNWSGKEIVLRDTNRFHYFKKGMCSCGDYWYDIF